MKKNYLLLCLVMLAIFLKSGTVTSQDINYSQFLNAPVYYNPAETGALTGLRARFLFRDQWPNLPVDFKSYHFCVDLGDRNIPGSGGIGLLVNSNNEGIGFIHDLNVALSVAVLIPFAENAWGQVGIKAAVVQKSLNWDDFVFKNQLDKLQGYIAGPSYITNENNKRVFPDFGAGGIIQFTNQGNNYLGTIGLAVDHLFEPDQSFMSGDPSKLQRKLVIHSDFIITSESGFAMSSGHRNFNGPLTMNPGFIYENQGPSKLLEVGLNLQKYNLYCGGWYRTIFGDNYSQALILDAGFRFMFQDDISIRFFYSYDLQISGPLMSMGGAHEISLILSFDNLQLFGKGNQTLRPRVKIKKGGAECSEF